MQLFRTFTSLSLCLAGAAALDWDATPFSPPSYPLAVRSPYLSTWLPQGEGSALNSRWPEFWAGQIAAWAGLLKVDGTAYSFLGLSEVDGLEQAVQKSAAFTSTQSTFVLSAGPVDITATFMSPVEPTDLLKHSIPFSYLALSAASTDGSDHSVQVYTDISGEWASGDSSLTVNWTTSTEGEVSTHQVSLVDQQPFAEISDHTQYGTVYYSTNSAQSLTYQTGSDADVRGRFVSEGTLANTEDTDFRAINDAYPVFAFSNDLGDVNAASDPVIISVGHVRDPVIQYIVEDGEIETRSGYFWSEYDTVPEMIDAFMSDYSAALSRANDLDAQVRSDAEEISSDYADIVELSIRQAFAATELSITKNDDGSWNTDDVIMFMKEISSNGNMNTIDVIFPTWPLYLYFNPAFGKYLLEAPLRYQKTGQYPNDFAVHDMGAHYPNATGHNDGADEHMPIEESSNMLIMALSYAQKSGDNSMIETYGDLFTSWGDYLIENALIPENQLSTDDFAGELANQTNLALKGIVAIGAMAEIATILGDTEGSATYRSTAEDFVNQVQDLAASDDNDHFVLSYGDSDSWGLSYNLYGDLLCSLNLFPDSVYEMQTNWYGGVANEYGVPLDTRATYTKSDWEIWTAATMTTTEARDEFVSAVRTFASGGTSSQPFADWYETPNGSPQGFRARPVAGGHLALLVLP